MLLLLVVEMVMLLLLLLLLLMMMLLLMVVLRSRMMAHVAGGVHTRRELPGVITHRVLLLLLHVICAVVHERGRETHWLLLIYDMLGGRRRRMWRSRIAAVRESLVKVDQVAGTPGAREWSHWTASAERHRANVIRGREARRNGRHGVRGGGMP